MSRCPSDTLDEDFVRELYLGEISDEDVTAALLALEPFREEIERKLADFDPEEHSWRQYRNDAFAYLPLPEPKK